MKLKSIFFSILAAAAMVGCSKESVDSTSNSDSEPKSEGSAINVYNPSVSNSSKLAFETTGTAGTGDMNIIMKWNKGDKFSVYNNTTGAYICDFEMVEEVSSEISAFESDYSLSNGDYMAIYPATDAANIADVVTSTNGITFTKSDKSQDYLTDYCYMSATFSFNTEKVASMSFQNLKSLLVVNATITAEPYDKVVVTDGDKIYSVLLSGIGSSYLSEIELLVDPVEGSRTVGVEFFNGSQSVYQEDKSVEVDFVASKIYYYSGPVSDIVWDGTIEPIEKGSGSATDPWVIETPSQLAGITQTGCYVVSSGGANFDLNNIEWTPIPTVKLTSFEGNGIVIKNLQITEADLAQTGLFSFLDDYSVIKDITLLAAEVSSANTTKEGGVGALIGKAENYTHVVNCHVLNSSVSHVTASGIVSVAGGLIGFSSWNGVSVSDCSVESSTITATHYTGGMVGYAYGAVRFVGCRSISNNVQGAPAGGIIGGMGKETSGRDNLDMKMIGCYLQGGVIGTEASSGSIGGLVGLGYAKYYGCYTDADYLSANMGAIVGKLNEVSQSSSGELVYITRADEMIYGTYTTSSNPIAAVINRIGYNGTSVSSWAATPSVSSITENGIYSTVEADPIKVDAITEVQMEAMNSAMEFGFQDYKVAHPKVKSAKFVKAPDGSPSPFIIEVEYK